MTSVLIAGSNRGLGLEWVRQCVERGWHVVATCRDPDSADDLSGLASAHPGVSIQMLDVTAPDQIASVARMLQDEPLDLLANNAWAYFERWGKDPTGSIDYDNRAETFRVNILGPTRVTEALQPNLARSERPLVALVIRCQGHFAICLIDPAEDSTCVVPSRSFGSLSRFHFWCPAVSSKLPQMSIHS
jgi:NAD(P)-dependent dehydrogenase (short-subunit alcohol dehydrogenase family)